MRWPMSGTRNGAPRNGMRRKTFSEYPSPVAGLKGRHQRKEVIMTKNIGRQLYCSGEQEPFGMVIDQNTLTREQLLDAVLGYYVVLLLDCKGPDGKQHYQVLENNSVERG